MNKLSSEFVAAKGIMQEVEQETRNNGITLGDSKFIFLNLSERKV